MSTRILILVLLLLSAPAHAITKASAGKEAFFELKRCVMENDPRICHAVITPGSYSLFERFAAYKLMPCLPTDFSYDKEETTSDGHVMLTSIMPAGNGQHYILRLLFTQDLQGLKLDVPASLQRGLGENWQNKIQLSEQLYLLMKQNLGDRLTCDQLSQLIQK